MNGSYNFDQTYDAWLREASPGALSAEQQRVFDEIIHAWLPEAAADAPVYVLHGLAGTGKTHLAAHLAHAIPNVHLMAHTGRAVANLARRTGMHAATIHRACHQKVENGRDRDGKPVLKFTRVPKGAHAGAIALIDEASQVSLDLYDALEHAGYRCIAIGDPGQLGPVSGTPAFAHDPHATLTEIHRQAKESGIICQAHAVREGRGYRTDGEQFERLRCAPADEHFRRADAVFCWRNDTRHALNRRIRTLRGFGGAWPQAGEVVMCLRNNPALGVFNGATYTLLDDYHHAHEMLVIELDGERTVIPGGIFVEGDDHAKLGRHEIPFDYGYALTVHKAQGSEWDHVLIVDEYPGCFPDRRAWLYTAITRAARRCVIGPR